MLDPTQDSGRVADASLPDAICCHLPPENDWQLPPRSQFQLFNLYSGESEERFADFEAVEIGGELTRGRGEGLAEVIEGHGSVAGDLPRWVG